MSSEDDASGHWVTVDGAHIFMKGGVVTKGPARLMGKKPSQFTRGSGESANRLHHKVSDNESSYHAHVAEQKGKDADLHTVHGTSSHSGGEKIPSQHGAEIAAHAEKYHAALKEFKASIEANGGHVTVAAAEKFKPHLAAMKATLHKAGFGNKGTRMSNANLHSDPAGLSRFILPTDSAEPRAVPMSLSGYPTEIEGQPVEYRRKEICRAGRTVRDVSGNPFHVTRDRIDKWTRSFERQKENGIPVFIPTKHSEILSSDNRGYVVEMAREGDSLYAVEQLIGEDAIRDVARNDQSVYIMLNAEDDRGNVYDECIQHVALTPAPQITGLNGFAKVAASRGPAADAVVLTLATTSEPERSFEMKPELSQKLREKLGVAKTVTDEQLAEQALEAFLIPPKPDATATAAMSRLEEENKALIKERDEHKEKAVAMSRLNPKVDDDTAFLVGESIATKRDIAVNNGAVTPAIAKELDKLFSDGDKPSVVAMSRLPGSAKPLAMRVWETLADNKPAALGEKTGRQDKTVAMSKLKEGGDDDGEGTPEEQKALRERVKARMGKEKQTA